MKKVGVVLCVVVLVSLSAWAGDTRLSTPGTRPEATAPAKTAPAVVVKHVLKNMYNSTGETYVNAVAGYNAVDSAITVSCPGTTGTCLIQADQWVQMEVPSGDDIGICLVVDGSDPNGCWVNSSVATDFYTVDSFSQGTTVSHGNHTVQTFVFDYGGGTFLAHYNVNYYVFKP